MRPRERTTTTQRAVAQQAILKTKPKKKKTYQRYDFWKRARAPWPPNFFGSHRRGSATSRLRSYERSRSLISFLVASSTSMSCNHQDTPQHATDANTTKRNGKMVSYSIIGRQGTHPCDAQHSTAPVGVLASFTIQRQHV